MSLKPTDIKYYVHTNKGATPLSNTWGALISVLDSCLITGYSNQTVQSSSISGTVLKLTYPADHNYLPGQVIKISGANQVEFNNEFRISIVPTSTTLHIDLTTEIASKGLSGTLSTMLPSLGWTSDYSDTGKRAYRNADVEDTERPYLRVLDFKDPNYNGIYAKSAKVGIVDGFTDVNTPVGIQTPFDPALPNKNWETSHNSSSGYNGWAKWFYSMSNDIYVANNSEYFPPSESNKRWVIVGNRDWFYLMPSMVTSKYSPIYFFGKLKNEDQTSFYGLSSTLLYDMIGNYIPVATYTPLSTTNTGFLIHNNITKSISCIGLSRITNQVPLAVTNYVEDISSKFVYSDVWISQKLNNNVYRCTMPSLKWALNPFDNIYDVKVIEDEGVMFLTKTIQAASAGTETPMLVAYDLTSSV